MLHMAVKYIVIICRAVCTVRHKVVSHILDMHHKDYDYTTKLLFERDSLSPAELQPPPIISAANIGNPKLFEALIIHSKIPPSTILKQKYKYKFSCPDSTVEYDHTETPLSLILSKQENYLLIDTLVDLDKADTCRHLITLIDLSETRTNNLPVELFKLRNLYRINVSNNKLSTLSLLKLPQNCWPNLLQYLDISHNSLEQIPLEFFQLPCLQALNVSHNFLKTLPEQWWATKSISTLDISYNNHLTSLSLKDGELPSSTTLTPISSFSKTFPVNVHGKVSGKISNYCIACRTVNSLLKILNASQCSINKFPSFLALFFPNLEELNLSYNKLLLCCGVNELPTSLECLDVSNNMLKSHLTEHKVFHIDNGLSTRSDYMVHKDLMNLHTLKLANNTDLKTVCISDETDQSSCHIFFPNLLRLDLSNCGLKQAPRYLEQLQKLTDLDISKNKNLYIPDEISNLESLVTFLYDDIEDPIVNELNIFSLTRDKQLYLHDRK